LLPTVNMITAAVLVGRWKGSVTVNPRGNKIADLLKGGDATKGNPTKGDLSSGDRCGLGPGNAGRSRDR